MKHNKKCSVKQVLIAKWKTWTWGGTLEKQSQPWLVFKFEAGLTWRSSSLSSVALWRMDWQNSGMLTLQAYVSTRFNSGK